jgi:hypothetical protein
MEENKLNNINFIIIYIIIILLLYYNENNYNRNITNYNN